MSQLEQIIRRYDPCSLKKNSRNTFWAHLTADYRKAYYPGSALWNPSWPAERTAAVKLFDKYVKEARCSTISTKGSQGDVNTIDQVREWCGLGSQVWQKPAYEQEEFYHAVRSYSERYFRGSNNGWSKASHAPDIVLFTSMNKHVARQSNVHYSTFSENRLVKETSSPWVPVLGDVAGRTYCNNANRPVCSIPHDKRAEAHSRIRSLQWNLATAISASHFGLCIWAIS